MPIGVRGVRMRVVLYTHPAMFEPALCLADALSDAAEVHLLLELPAGGWHIASFEASGEGLPSGLVPADPVLAPLYPSAVRDLWRRTASFHLVVPGGYRSRDPRSMLIVAETLRWIRALRPDIVHIDDIDISARLAALLAVRRVPYPLLMGCHDPDPHSGERRWRLKRWVRLLLLPRADACLVHHAAGRAAFQRRHPRFHRPVHVVRLGAYTFLPSMSGPAATDPVRTGRTALLFGRLSPYKGLEQLFRVAPRVSALVEGLRLVVAGKPAGGYTPPAPPSLQRGGTVETTYDYVSGERAAALFRAADVVVCPYTDASQSGVVLTAFAFGCPVVATDVGGLGEYVDDGVSGLLVPTGDDTALAEAIARCLDDAPLMQRLRAGVAEAVTGSLSWRRVASELLDVYAGVIAGSGRAAGRTADSGDDR